MYAFAFTLCTLTIANGHLTCEQITAPVDGEALTIEMCLDRMKKEFPVAILSDLGSGPDKEVWVLNPGCVRVLDG
jgi:hypothetical protein